VARGVDRNDVMLLSSLMRLVVAFLANTSYDLRIHAVVFAKVGWVFGSPDFHPLNPGHCSGLLIMHPTSNCPNLGMSLLLYSQVITRCLFDTSS
jgi:hypothetical protein